MYVQILNDHWKNGDINPNAKAYTNGHLAVIVSIDDPDERYHLSISHRRRMPTWDEIGQARRELLPPDLHFCIPHPPEKFWINVHPYCLHLWEIRDEKLTKAWEWEGAMAQNRRPNKPPTW